MDVIKMRILHLEEYVGVNLPQPEISASSHSDQWEIITLTKVPWHKVLEMELPKSCQSEAVLQRGKAFYRLSFHPLNILKLDQESSVTESCETHVISSDGQTLFGYEPSGQIVAICNWERMKSIPAVGSQQRSFYEQIESIFMGLCRWMMKSPSTVAPETFSKSSLFPMLQSTRDGLAVLCLLKPEECFVYTCQFQQAFRWKHVSNNVRNRIPGKWWKILIAKDSIRNWLQGKVNPQVEARLTPSKGHTEDVSGTIAYSAIHGRGLSLMYGTFGKNDLRFELKWNFAVYELDFIIAHDKKQKSTSSPIGKMNFVTRLSSNAGQIAIAANNHLGAYIYVNSLPAEKPLVKMNRLDVDICSHCVQKHLIYYEENCWISSLEWLSEDNCYFACITRCGCLSVFHKSAEVMILKITKAGFPGMDMPCNFFYQIFDSQRFLLAGTNDDSKKKSVNTHLQLKWQEENILSVMAASKLFLFRIQRVSNVHGTYGNGTDYQNNLL